MKRVVAGLLVLAACVVLVTRVRTHEPVPCITVTRGNLAHQITAEGTLRAAIATEIKVPASDVGSLVIVEYATDGTLVETGAVIARFDRTRAEANLRQVTDDVATSELQLRLEQIRARISAAEQAAAVTAAELTLEQAKQPVDPSLLSRNQNIEATLDADLARERLAQARRAAATDREVSRSNLSLATINRDRSLAARERARTLLASLELRAPYAGLLLLGRDPFGNLRKVGTRLWPDEPVAVLPDPTRMTAELFVLEVDGNGIAEGQRVEIVVASHPETVFAGTVEHFDKLAKPRDPRVPVQYVGVTAAFDHTDTAIMKVGQRVRATIKLEHVAVIAVPRHAVFDEGGVSIVYRRTTNGFVRTPVSLGAMTAGRVVITAGLSDGDVIASRPVAGAR